MCKMWCPTTSEVTPRQLYADMAENSFGYGTHVLKYPVVSDKLFKNSKELHVLRLEPAHNSPLYN